MLNALRHRLRRLRARADAGVTLVEVMVSMALSTLIGAMTLTLFVQVNDSTQTSVDRAINTAQARQILQSWTSYLHVADGPSYGNASHRFEWITSTDMLFYADLANRSADADSVSAPTVVWLRLTNQRLIEEQFTYGTTTPKVCRVLADNVTAAPLFTAYDTTYASMTGQNLGQPIATGGAGCTNLPSSVTQTDFTAVAALQDVARVEIDFTITDTRNKHSVPFFSSADVPTLSGATS